VLPLWVCQVELQYRRLLNVCLHGPYFLEKNLFKHYCYEFAQLMYAYRTQVIGQTLKKFIWNRGWVVHNLCVHIKSRTLSLISRFLDAQIEWMKYFVKYLLITYVLNKKKRKHILFVPLFAISKFRWSSLFIQINFVLSSIFTMTMILQGLKGRCWYV
jgi:hypothetical protein